jgi:hypothetical protein
MKRTILFFTLVFCAAALVMAHGNNRWGSDRFPGGPRPHAWGQNSPRNQTPRPAPESATVSGNLTIAQGMIAVVSGDTTWLVRGLNRYVGFIDGLKEGAQVTLEGYATPAGSRDKDKNIKSLHVQKMTLNGKDYELARPQQRQWQDARPGPMQRQGPMYQQQRPRGRR